VHGRRCREGETKIAERIEKERLRNLHKMKDRFSCANIIDTKQKNSAACSNRQLGPNLLHQLIQNFILLIFFPICHALPSNVG
jgi:hypothetical protein